MTEPKRGNGCSSGSGKATILVFLAVACTGRAQAADALKDFSDIMRIKAAYEDALNHDDLDRLMPYLNEGFTGMFVTGDEVSDRRALQAYWDKVKRMISQGQPGSSYRVKLNPEDVRIDGDSAVASGSTDEEVVTGRGQRLKYRSRWSVRLRKDDGRWSVSNMESKADVLDKLTLAVRAIAMRIWFPAHYLRAPTDRDPDFDGDRGRNDNEKQSF